MTKKVPAISRFIEAPDSPCSAMSWFREQSLSFNEHAFDWGAALYFKDLAELRLCPDGSIDADVSPVVAVYLPRVRRGVLWTVGEVRFCPVPLSQFPELQRLRRSFLRWFEQSPLVYDDRRSAVNEFDYYLEGSAKNFGPIRAFQSGLRALQKGQYFIARFETDGSLKKLSRALALRGVICADHD
jgi:hypothetical protein